MFFKEGLRLQTSPMSTATCGAYAGKLYPRPSDAPELFLVLAFRVAAWAPLNGCRHTPVFSLLPFLNRGGIITFRPPKKGVWHLLCVRACTQEEGTRACVSLFDMF